MKESISELASNLGIAPTAVVTILVSIFVFLMGILINSIISISKAYLQRSIHRRLSEINYRDLLRKLYKQSHDLKHIADQLTINHLGNYDFKYNNITSVDIFKQIGYENLYKAYLTGFENLNFIYQQRKLKVFSLLWGIVDYTQSTHQDSIKRLEKFQDDLGKMNFIRNEAIGKVQLNIEAFRIRFHKQLDLREPLGIFYDARERIIQEFTAQENQTLPENVQSYLDKLIQLNRENVDLCNRYENDIKSVQLNSDILYANLAFQNFVGLIKATNGIYNHLYLTYLSHYEQLKLNYKYLHFSYRKEILMAYVKSRLSFRKWKSIRKSSKHE